MHTGSMVPTGSFNSLVECPVSAVSCRHTRRDVFPGPTGAGIVLLVLPEPKWFSRSYRTGNRSRVLPGPEFIPQKANSLRFIMPEAARQDFHCLDATTSA
jgi:hypothetical protein